MSLQELAELSGGREDCPPFVEIVLTFSPDLHVVKPWIKQLDRRLLTMDEWRTLISYVGAWYDSITDEEIEAHNHRWAQAQTMPPAEREQAIKKAGHIYILKSAGHYKIGHAANLKRRMSQFATTLPHPSELVHSFHCDDVLKTEGQLHTRFADLRMNGEWFSLDEEDIAWLKTL